MDAERVYSATAILLILVGQPSAERIVQRRSTSKVGQTTHACGSLSAIMVSVLNAERMYLRAPVASLVAVELATSGRQITLCRLWKEGENAHSKISAHSVLLATEPRLPHWQNEERSGVKNSNS
jgi:hypothetical protein